MGYHVILNNKGEDFQSIYVDDYRDLFDLDLCEDSVIYKGFEDWKPIRVGEKNGEYKELLKPEFKAGYRAEELFYQAAIKNEQYIIERIDQSQKSFKGYIEKRKQRIKRGDFLIRNVHNIEIEVKCLSVRNECFCLGVNDYEGHLNMQILSGIPVLFAFYQREGDRPKSDTFRMISNYRVSELIEDKTIRKEENSTYISIPISKTEKGFSKIEDFRGKITVQID